MKKVFTVLTAIIISAAAFSQVSVGVQGIANLSNAKINTQEVMNPSQSAIFLPGAGLVAEINLGDNLAIRPAINYLQQGFTLKGGLSGDFEGEVSSVTFNGKTTLDYLQVPVNVLYRFPSRYYQWYVGAGAYASYGISGKIKITNTIKLTNGETEVETEQQNPYKKEGGEDAGLKRGDFGVNALAGIKFSNGLFANVGYQLGLSNINGDEAGQFKNRGFQITLGYFFWNK